LTIIINSKENVRFDLNSLAKLDSSDLPISDLTFVKDSKKYKMKLYVESGNSKNGVLVNVTWKLLLTKK
jgi:hypothetical protein